MMVHCCITHSRHSNSRQYGMCVAALWMMMLGILILDTVKAQVATEEETRGARGLTQLRRTFSCTANTFTD
jgi:hypothetical protein